jgi:hypothetical protein
MELWLSAEIQHDVSEEHRQIANQIEPTINNRLSSDYGPSVVEWALITILRPRIPKGWGEVWRYHRARKVAEFRLIIDHNEFKRADRSKQRSMLLASIFRSMDIFPFLEVAGFDLDRFRRDVQAIALSEGWKVAGEDQKDQEQ